MYVSKYFEESRVEVMHALMRSYPLGALVVKTASGLEANHVPFVTDPNPAPWGTVRCHVARANPVWSLLEQASDVLVIFQGPDAYISPSVYEAKEKDGKVVPTWNYVAVHAYGTARVIQEREWLLNLLNDLTVEHEAGRKHPWRVTDAPSDYIDKLLNAIVGIEIKVDKLVGKWKMSQNRSRTDRASVADDLRARSGAHANMIELLER